MTGIEQEWENILDHNTNYYSYLTAEWYKMWLEHFIKDEKCKLLMFYKDDVLNMIVPLIYENKKCRGADIKTRKLVGNVYMPIKSVIITAAANNLLAIMQRLVDYFEKTKDEWNIIDFDDLPSEEPWVEAFCEAINRSTFKSKSYDCFGNWYSDEINGTSKDFLDKRSKNFRASIKKNYKKLQQNGEIDFRLVTGERDCPDYFTHYNEVYSRSWKKEERVGRTFFPAMVKYAERNGWLRLGLLFLDGTPIAAGFAIVTGGRAYFEKIAYDEKYKGLGAGSVCLYEMIRHVIDMDSVSTIDFLRGDDEYKRHWVDKRRARKGITIYNNNLRGKYLSFMDKTVIPVINGNKIVRKIKESVFRRLR
ncbi:GNAT family N-acetyltransferase [Geobacter hydrogenophilus]|nr:GNAT family N-acetyltransferase [Geobacter hydrogenophilus]MBT0892923.1 GNAT family N-acetyltransferase [Geobacter hydrogenophilus]